MRIGFWLRWSGRELRRRWVQVGAIALIIALGTGVQAGLGSSTVWRQRSYDASYAMLHVHDLRLSLEGGSFVEAGALARALDGIQHAGWIERAEERLVLPTQVEASTPSGSVLVPGRVVGVDVGNGPVVDAIFRSRGRSLGPADDGTPVVVLEEHFARFYDLPEEGRLVLPGAARVEYVGTGFSPEYFMVIDETVGFSIMAEANLAVLFAPLETAQSIAGHPGRVNDLVLRLAPGVRISRARSEIRDALAAALPGLAVTIATRAQDRAYRFMYGDLDTDQRTFDLLALLMLIAAVFAAFNLTSRIVEAQRREIGIGMALGARRSTIALRPLLIGAEIAVLGVVFGVGVGMLVGVGLRSEFQRLLPLPVWETPFQPARFAGAAVLGFLLPFLATAWPVWRAVRVQPVEAIRTGHLASRGGGLAPLVRRVTVPGGTFAQMPIRGVLRAPRRSLLTAIGIGASIMALVSIFGMLDSLAATIDRGDAELLRGGTNRLRVDLAGFERTDSEVVSSINGSDVVAAAEPMVRVAGELRSGGVAFDVQIEALDLGSAIWHPTIGSRVDGAEGPGIVISEKAARDLGAIPGETIEVMHPVREGPFAFGTSTTPMRVLGLHPSPLRSFAYIDVRDLDLMGLSGVTNTLQVLPAPGRTIDQVKREMFALPHVAAVQPVSAMAQTLRDVIDQMVGIFTVIELFAVVLALLVAFNAASINVDARAREHATMFAFGTRLRTLLRMTSVESLLVGLVGSVIGLAAGTAALRVLLDTAAADSPDVGMVSRMAPASIVAALAFGAAAALAASLLTARKLRRMDVASTLRVME